MGGDVDLGFGEDYGVGGKGGGGGEGVLKGQGWGTGGVELEDVEGGGGHQGKDGGGQG